MKMTTKELFVMRDALNELITTYVIAQRFIKAHETALLRDRVQEQIDAQIDPA